MRTAAYITAAIGVFLSIMYPLYALKAGGIRMFSSHLPSVNAEKSRSTVHNLPLAAHMNPMRAYLEIKKIDGKYKKLTVSLSMLSRDRKKVLWEKKEDVSNQKPPFRACAYKFNLKKDKVVSFDANFISDSEIKVKSLFVIERNVMIIPPWVVGTGVCLLLLSVFLFLKDRKTPAFLCDRTVGKLAKKLRALGYDTKYSEEEDDILLSIASNESRVILTRKRNMKDMSDERGVRCLFLESDYFDDQLRQVVSTFKLDIHALRFTRCLECNEVLRPVDKLEVRDKVPPYVYATQDKFVECPSCKRIFWPATHREKMDRDLDVILRRQNKSF